MRDLIDIVESAQGIEVPWHGDDYLTLHVGSTTLKYAVYRNFVDIVDLDTPVGDRGKGQAKAAMNALIGKADQEGVGIRLLSYPQDDVTEQGRLNAFYRRLGFTKLKKDPDGGILMFRQPGRANIVENASTLTFNTERQPLDFDRLYGKAFRVTDAEGDPRRDGFSIITPFANRSVWDEWRERPEFKRIVKQRLNDAGFLGDHKYEQIVDAANRLNLLETSTRDLIDIVENASRQLNEDQFSAGTYRIQRRKLNVPLLIKKGAIRVTYPGDGKGGWEDTQEDWSFSIVTLCNIKFDTRNRYRYGSWPLKPQSYAAAEHAINASRPNLGSDDLIYDGKYNQILWSIKELGIPDEEAFLGNGE